ncbi:sodium-dependent transporter [Vibrio anguillarum]|uniref:Sodium-dependent transporter n=1 Tax=Vibrio anguillarum TaxID=55601 RepID=A0A289GBS6_VIBAN|nr:MULTISPECIES: sodium-dependent transporter [Vibrio]ASW80871.1 sodium-dependent transporter [Vibrio anguillarum]AXN04949.1 sodium-dependent transporter [Vibrio anguillarum]AZS26077.1 sodium-dependent transporter [Vibrio anguillarum]MBF4308397.1 sodium-dependent transporter [Vibrio anguillarum]MBF4325999.1 sodium-dependent transporter [Vibrio anguillarum]
MASSSRGHFSSRLGFIMAAAGSAVGLGNVWGFPTKAASNGGAAFLVIYLTMVFLLAFPMLVAELTIGRHGQSNPIASLRSIWTKNRAAAALFGIIAMIASSMILSFYSILAGWLMGFAASPILGLLGLQTAADWLVNFSGLRNVLLALAFSLLTIYVVRKGVADGIEKWSTRLMPVLFILFGAMIAYIFTQDGAMEGLKMYLIPDIAHITPSLLVDAMGQAFFSLSLGVGAMIVYGSYLKKDVNLPKTAAQVAAIDTGVAFAAGLLILPAMFVAKNHGVEIFDDAGNLMSSGDLVFTVLPAMFDNMGSAGVLLGFGFFILMVIAALTSSISMLEVPVSCAQDELKMTRSQATWMIGGAIALLSIIISLNFGALFNLVANVSTVYMQPLLGVVWAIVVGWVWHRNKLLDEIKQGNPDIAQSLFWKIWPWYVRFVCPVAILMVFAYSLI